MKMIEPERSRRTGASTRTAIRDTALRLFTERGFEGTSIKDIADAVGTTKSSLYYHFDSKEAIIRNLLDERQAEFEELRTWAEAKAGTPDLLQQVATRWLDSADDARLDGMRFAMANGPAVRRLVDEGHTRRPWLEDIIDVAIGTGASATERMQARMLFEMLSAAVAAARGTSATTTQIVATARRAIQALAALPKDVAEHL